MLPTKVNKWTSSQIIFFSRWLSYQNHLRFMDIINIERELNKLDFNFLIHKGHRCPETINHEKFKTSYWLTLGEKQSSTTCRLTGHIEFPAEYGIWTHKLVLIIMIHLKLIVMPKRPIDMGGIATLAFCIKTWGKVLDEQASLRDCNDS